MMASDARVLSIQSHVVSGYVGNRSAVFPLQVLGFDVDIINSVQFSNHTGYEHIRGQRLNAQELLQLYEGLKLNRLHHYSHVLTGYVGTVDFASQLVDIIKELKELNSGLYFVCDPVMGDNGKMYVPDEVLPVYRDRLLPLADLITPNQYEAELLSGLSIKTRDDVMKAMNVLHGKGVETVVISSVELESHKDLLLFGSTVKGDETHRVCMEIPKLCASFTGSGDLFAAVLLAWMTTTQKDLRVSCEKAVNTTHSVLLRTLKNCKRNLHKDSSSILELKLIQSKKDIEDPPSLLQCQAL